MASHAACPTTEQIGTSRFRVYFSPRNHLNQSLIASLEIDVRDPLAATAITQEPVLSPGPIGRFDDTGVTVGSVVPHEGGLRLYYMGWNVHSGSGWQNNIGLCERTSPAGKFERVSERPILGVNQHDRHSLTYPWVHRGKDGWRAWYGSHIAQGSSRADIRHVVKMARSEDGLDWVTNDSVAIGLVGDDFAVTRPCIIRDAGLWKMWYSRCREDEYRIGYAESTDGLAWHILDDRAGIVASQNGWDKDSVEYPCVFDSEGDRFMLYCGSDYGRSGFGIAILEQD